MHIKYNLFVKFETCPEFIYGLSCNGEIKANWKKEFRRVPVSHGLQGVKFTFCFVLQSFTVGWGGRRSVSPRL